MNKLSLYCFISQLFFLSGLVQAQDFEFRNSVYGIDICLLDRFQIELGASNSFQLNVNGLDFIAEIENSIERTCTIPAKSYSFQFKDGESYRFIFSYKHKQKGLIHIDQKVTYRKPKLFSLSVGVNEASMGLPALKTAQKSAAEFNQAAKSPFFFPLYGRGQSYLVSTGTELPVAANVEKRLATIKNDIKDGDLFLFYFAGHGIGSEKGYSFILGKETQYDGNSFSDILRQLPPDSEKIVIVCSCYSRYLWQHIYDIPNVSFIYAGKSAIQGDLFAERLMLLLSKCEENEMTFDIFAKSITEPIAESGILPLHNSQNYQVSLAATPETNLKYEKFHWAPVFLSIIPGAGQFYKHDFLKGSLITGTAIASGIGIAVCETRRAKYAAQMSQTYDVQALNELSNRVNGYSTGRTICIVAASAAVVYGIVDTAVAPSKRIVQITPTGLVYNF